MLKKIVPLFLVVFMVFGLIPATATGYDIADDLENNPSTVVSGEILTDSGVLEDAPDAIMNRTNSSVIGSPAQISESMVSETAEESGRNITSGETTISENSTKYNGMAAAPVAETPAASRYSTVKVSLAPDIAGTQYEEAAELLGALGIMVGDAGTGAFRPNDPIIRSEMAKVAVYSVGLEDIAQSSMGATGFPDVPANHWATGAINVAHQQGMVIGDDVGTFRPDDPVLLQEAIAIVVRAMGYEPAAADKGGYPAGYMYIASSNQLLRGLSGTADKPATRGDIAQLIFNSLTVNLMEQVGFGSSVTYEVVDKTLLYDRLNVEKGYGQITATGETGLTGGSTTAEDRIQIGDKLFYVGDTHAKQMLGYNVLYYARLDKTTDNKTLINVREQANKNDSVTVAAKNIVTVTGDVNAAKTFEYWANTNDTRTKTASIAADAVYIYNGKYKTGVTSEQLKPTAGNVTLLDADTNGIYEIVFVNHFTNIVVDTVSTITGRVTDKYMNGSLVFDKNNTNVMYTLLKNGEEIDISALREWNIISYTISDDSLLIKAYVSDASVNGIVTEITDQGYRIGSSTERYKKAASYPNDINLNDRGTFYLDIEGNIAAVDEKATVDTEVLGVSRYGYLVDAVEETTFNTTLKLKIFTSTGETLIASTPEKLRFNDNYTATADSVYDALSGNMPQLIMYETNTAGEITAIDTAENGTGTGAPNKGTFTLNIAETEMTYKSASGKLGTVGVAENTIIFDIPRDAGTDTDKYSIRNHSTLSNNTSYNAIVYDLQENYVASVIIITSSTGLVAAENPLFLVDYIAETQTEDYTVTDRLYGWQDGKKIDILAEDRSVLIKSGSTKVKQGDIIQYRLNRDGEIDSITVLFNTDNMNTEFVTAVTDDLTCVYGRVTKKFAGSVNVSINGDIRNFATGNAIVYLYDSSKATNNIQVVSAADIEIYEEGNEARLFLKIYEDSVTEMVIVK